MISFGRYVLSAGAASVVDLAFVQALLLLPLLHSGLMFGVAVVAGALVGMSVNFALSRRFVFDKRGDLRQAEMLKFFVISLSTLIMRVAVAYLAMAVLALPVFAWVSTLPLDAPATRIAHIASMGLVTIYSFFAHKHISFAVQSGLAKPGMAR
jgi:putative flippase GtrA